MCHRGGPVSGHARQATWKIDRKADAEASVREALAAAQAVVTNLPNSANDQHALSQVAASLAIVLGPTGPAAARAAEVIAVGVGPWSRRSSSNREAGYDYFRKKLFDLSLLQARTLNHLGRPSEALEAVGRAARVEAATDAKAGVLVAQHYALLGQKVMADPAIPAARREAAAEPYYQQALEGLRRAAGRGHKEWASVRQMPVFAGLKERPEFQAITAGKWGAASERGSRPLSRPDAAAPVPSRPDKPHKPADSACHFPRSGSKGSRADER